jgi:hypothetical protein
MELLVDFGNISNLEFDLADVGRKFILFWLNKKL